MAIKFVRIDDRLIHGQVVTTWMKKFSIEQVIVIDNKIAKNEIQIQALNMTAPSNIKLNVFDVEKFSEIYKKVEIKRETLLLFTNPMDVLDCLKNGVEFPTLNVGGMKHREGREKLTKAVAASLEEKEAFRSILEKGVNVEVQMVPNDKLTLIQEYI
ncbi:MAG: PTS system mannose/fructose/N-acetylgalactosamine-transporter subunit IIB [Cetobacterium sp.]